MTFTAHNIALPDGTWTLPGVTPTAETGICQAALRDLALAFPCYGGTSWHDAPPGDRPRVADLGCLEGGYAAAFARAGYQVLGVEARPVNYACCELVRDALRLPGLEFAQDDARNLEAHGEFDAVFCCGLLYHLDEPAPFLRMLGKVTRRLLILQTHYAAVPDGRDGEGNLGTRFPEDTTARWSSWGNKISFWLARGELLALIREAGFPVVYEQHDYRDDIALGIYRDAAGGQEQDRGMFIGIKP